MSSPRVFALALVLVGCTPPKPEAPKPEAVEAVGDASRLPPAGPDDATSKPPPTDIKPAAGRVENGFFVAEGAPDPRACATDSDCKGDTVADRTGCCQAPTQVVAHSRAYAAWVHKWRAGPGACADVTCPPPPAPARPNACLFDVKCVEQVCENQCEAE